MADPKILGAEMPEGVRYEGIFDEGEPQLAMQKRSSSPGAAYHPMLAPPLAAAERAALDPARTVSQADAAREHGLPLTSTTAFSSRARERLSPELVSVLVGDAEAVRRYARDGKVEVKLLLDPAQPAARDALRRAGLSIRTSAERWVAGTIDVSRLAELAEVPGVLRVLPFAG